MQSVIVDAERQRFLALRHSCWNALISHRALAPVQRKQTGASALRLICNNDQHAWRRARFLQLVRSRFRPRRERTQRVLLEIAILVRLLVIDGPPDSPTLRSP